MRKKLWCAYTNPDTPVMKKIVKVKKNREINVKKKVDPEISRGARKLLWTPRLKKAQKKNTD